MKRVLAALVLVPAALPLLVLAAAPSRLLPGLPRYRYEALPGDAYGYYYGALETFATARRDAPVIAVVLVVAALVIVVAHRRTADPALRVVAWTWSIGLVAAAVAASIRFTGAAQIGWSFLWSVPLLPLRAVGAVTPGAAFGVGLCLSIVCNAAAVVAIYVLARRAGLRDGVALAGAALLSLWPFLSLLAGHDAAANGTWQIWLGLSLYTEPLSTALVTVAVALLLDERRDRSTAVAGAVLGFATLVRNSNVLILACALVGLAVFRRWRAAALTALPAAAWAPAALLFWPKGYPRLRAPLFPAHPFELSYASRAWTHSTLWHPAVLIVLVPLAAVGLLRCRPLAQVVLGAAIATTAVFYTFYELTPLHPRFLFVVVPMVLMLWTAGAAEILARVARR